MSQNLNLGIASASDLQQAQPLRKQAMFLNMADGRSCEDDGLRKHKKCPGDIFCEEQGAVQSKILGQFRGKALPTVEEVLERHNLKFAPHILGQRDVVVLETSKYTWILMPIQESEADSLIGKVTEVDALDYEVMRKLLENSGLLFSPVAETDPYFAMTQWV